MRYNINARFVRYTLFFVSILILSYAVQVFVQNFSMEETIRSLKQQQILLKGETYWMKNYYDPFLKTDYAKLFFQHKEGIVDKDEILIKFVSKQYDYSGNYIELGVDNKPSFFYTNLAKKRNEFFLTLFRKFFSL